MRRTTPSIRVPSSPGSCTPSWGLETGFLQDDEVKVKMLVAQSCPTLCNLTDCSPPGSSVNGILQARILEWVPIPFSRGSSQLRCQTWISHIAGRFFTIWTTREAPFKVMAVFKSQLGYWFIVWAWPSDTTLLPQSTICSNRSSNK